MMSVLRDVILQPRLTVKHSSNCKDMNVLYVCLIAVVRRGKSH